MATKSRAILISPPGFAWNIPSIQIAVLKSYMTEKGIDVDTVHGSPLFASLIGVNRYIAIRQSAMLCGGEVIYSGLIFPEIKKMQDKTYADSARLRSHLEGLWSGPLSITLLRKLILKASRHFISSIPWDRYDLIGFSMVCNQNLSTIYLATEIKKLFPKARIVIGGAMASGELGESLLKNFNCFDYAVDGEGEKPLHELISSLRSTSSSPQRIAGLSYRLPSGKVERNQRVAKHDKDHYPTPDYSDYFKLVYADDELSQRRAAISAPILASRGCNYQCKFCSNSHGERYRHYEARAITDAIDEIATKYHVLKFMFVDNYFPPTIVEQFTRHILRHNRQYELAMEMRAPIPRKALETLKNAGLHQIQIGVESLSNVTLKKMKKGLAVIDNVETMRNCNDLGIECHGNIITRYPGVTKREITQCMDMIGPLFHLFPLQISRLQLYRDSSLFRQAKSMGLKKICNDVYYNRLYPSRYTKKLDLHYQQYSYKEGFYCEWNRLEKRCLLWTKEQEELRDTYVTKNLLSAKDGGNYLIIEDNRSYEHKYHILDDAARAFYLLIYDMRHEGWLQEKLGSEVWHILKPTISHLRKNELIYHDGSRYISLACLGENASKILCEKTFLSYLTKLKQTPTIKHHRYEL